MRVNSLEATAPFRYLRLREPPYDDAALAAWAGRLRPLLEDGVRVYCYFKHEDEPTGTRLRGASRLSCSADLVGDEAGSSVLDPSNE